MHQTGYMLNEDVSLFAQRKWTFETGLWSKDLRISLNSFFSSDYFLFTGILSICVVFPALKCRETDVVYPTIIYLIPHKTYLFLSTLHRCDD